ncbi:FAD-dependent oxidoreductase [Glutamicibacter sp. X7]
MESTEYLVVGAGLAGAATAWQLARQGYEVQVVERDRPASAEGSSHGSARIFRFAYTDELYVRLAQRAKTGWDELSELAGQELVSSCGAVDYGEVRDPVQLADVLRRCGVEHELFSAEEACQRWPQFAFDTPVLWQPGAGVIDAESAVLAMLDQAQLHGARLHTGWTLERLERSTDGFVATSVAGQHITARRVIVAAGGWLPYLLPGLPLPEHFRAALPEFQVRQEQAYHFRFRDPQRQWPTFIHLRSGWECYGLPGGRDSGFAGLKVAEFNGGKIIQSAAAQDGIVDPGNRAAVVDYVAQNIPGVEPVPYAETTCLFTNTPTEDFVIDEVDGLTILSACSGHGAKFAPVLGELAAAVASGTGSTHERFRPSRTAGS